MDSEIVPVARDVKNTGMVERDGRRLVVQLISDIDGTCNFEDVPEAERLASSGPAADAFAPFTSELQISLMSARTIPEIEGYARKLGISGFEIGEDGGVIALPKDITDAQVADLSAAGIIIDELDGRRVVLTSATSTEDIAAIMRAAQEEFGTPTVSTVTSTPEEIQQAAGHQSRELAVASMQRKASAYAVGLTPKQHQIILERMEAAGIRMLGGTYDNVTQYFGNTAEGEPADKRAALRLLDRIVAIMYKVDGMLPVVFGNGKNDIPLLNMALEIGGRAVLIPDRSGNPFFDENLIPKGVLRATKPAGHGIKEVLRRDIVPWLEEL